MLQGMNKQKSTPTSALFCAKSLNQTNGSPEATIVTVHVHLAGIEAQVPRFLRAISRGRPIDAVGSDVVDSFIVPVISS